MTTADTKTSLGARGHLAIWRVDETGRHPVSAKKNTLTTTGFEAFSRLIGQITGNDPAEDAIHSLWLEASATALPAAAVSDTGPQGSVVKRYVFDRAVDITPNAGGTSGLTQFRATLTKLEGNGQTIRAGGLYTRNDNDDPALATSPELVARQVFGAIDKTADFALEFVWTIQFLTV